jgi:REP element-mobilizing transposase RayT
MTYWELYVHVVWATKHREASLTAEEAEIVEKIARSSCRELGVVVHEACAMPDHVHLAMSVPPKLSLSDVVQRVKGTSSRAINQTRQVDGGTAVNFSWQPEYGALSFGKRSLPTVREYIRTQHQRHGSGSTIAAMERISKLELPPSRVISAQGE